jgi:hypothetical protein
MTESNLIAEFSSHPQISTLVIFLAASINTVGLFITVSSLNRMFHSSSFLINPFIHGLNKISQFFIACAGILMYVFLSSHSSISISWNFEPSGIFLLKSANISESHFSLSLNFSSTSTICSLRDLPQYISLTYLVNHTHA